MDSAPQVLPYPNVNGISDDEEFFTHQNKIFFQTLQSAPVDKTMLVPKNFVYEWSSLEVPDPRFNYKASNWVQNNDQNAIPQKGINPSTLSLLGKDGRDGDIYMAVSNIGELQSPGELGFIVRPFAYDLMGKPVDFRTQKVDPQLNLDDSKAYFRTIRLYDHGDPSDKINCAHDHIYDYFTAMNPDGTLPGVRVNPLSDLPVVLSIALGSTPADYYWAGSKKLAGGGPPPATVNKYAFDKILGAQNWGLFTNGWTKCFINARKVSNLNTSWKSNLSDVYGDNTKFGWYAKDDAYTVFDGGFPAGKVTLSKPLNEIDRKMLMSYTLESFSDRQQLFLYILRAETTVPSFGGSTDSGVKSLAGGRAVALVWRDPYPIGYVKNPEKWNPNYYQDSNAESPWAQYYPGRTANREDGYHEHRILFFKQLDN